MDIQKLRQSLKLKWLSYFEENSSWLVKMQIWRSYDGVRRPSSGYILATLSVLEPRLQQLLPFLLELNNNPDQIVAALGLDFNPDEELRLLKSPHCTTAKIAFDNIQVSEKPSTKPPQEKKQALLRIVPSAEQKHQCVSVVTMNRPVTNHSRLAKEETFKQPDKLGIGRSPTMTAPVSTKNQAVPSKVSVSEFHHQYQFTGIPVKEISYISSTTNARSLPAWMDEFCPGVK